MNEERVAIFIDGSNLYYSLKHREHGLHDLLQFDYAGLCKYFAEDRHIVSKYYYIGVVRVSPKDPDKEKAEKMQREQVILFRNLQSKRQGFVVKRGYLMKTDGVYHEKGVDVHIAVDLVVGAYENAYDTAIVISSDTDLIPALESVRKKGKRVEYIGFSTRPSIALQKHANLSRLLTKSELEKFSQNPS